MTASDIREVRKLAIWVLGITEDQASELGSKTHATDGAEPSISYLPDSKTLWRAARKEIARQRTRIGDPDSPLASAVGWAILLDLFDSNQRGEDVSITSACFASGAPLTTALRYIGVLIDNKLVFRIDDPSDRRRAYLILSPKGEKAVRDTLAAQLLAESKIAAEFYLFNGGK